MRRPVSSSKRPTPVRILSKRSHIMSRALYLAPVAAALAVALPALAATAPSGVVVGPGGVYQHAKVCIDRNANARCDAREKAVFTDAEGRFTLRGSGRLVAEVGKGALFVDGATGAKTPVRRALTFRLAATGKGNAIGPVSTELQAMADGGGDGVREILSSRMHVEPGTLLDDPASLADPAERAAHVAEQARLVDRIANAVAAAGRKGDLVAELDNRLDLEGIRNVVVIYAENRSFNNVFAGFPDARSVVGAKKAGALVAQKDRDGSVLDKLPPAWGGLTAAGQSVVVTQAQTTNVLPNAPFQIDSPNPAWGVPALSNTIVTRDLYHRFYENQMQIDGGLNDKFAAWGDSGGTVMGYFDGSRTAMWKIARDYTLADRFFQGAFGGSYLNHQYLICACMPVYPDADTNPAKPSITILRTDADGKFTPDLALADNSPASALTGPPVFKKSGDRKSVV